MLQFSRSVVSCLVNFKYMFLICCTCHFQSGSLFFVYFFFLCLQVFSVSNCCPDTRGWRWSLILAHLFSCVVGRKEHCKQISLVCGDCFAVYGPHWVCPSSGKHVISRSTLLRLQVALQGYCWKWALRLVHFLGLSCSSSGSWVK